MKRFRITLELEAPDYWDPPSIAEWLRECLKPEVPQIEIVEGQPEVKP